MPTIGPEDAGAAICRNPASLIDHTLLKADADESRIALLCEEAVENGFASVCIPPVHVRRAAALLYGTEVTVGTVVGFPLGFVETSTKLHEAALAFNAGARELDMVINQGWAAAGDFDRVEKEVGELVRAVPEACVKVIIECCHLGKQAKVALTRAVVSAGAGYVKTSTGFAASGATLEDVRLLAETSAGRIGVKAAGGIRTYADCLAMVEAGATRIGTSSGCSILQQWRESEGLA